MKRGYSQNRPVHARNTVSDSVTLDLPLKPAPLTSAILIFAATSLLFVLSLYLGLPYLRHKGVSWFCTYNLVLVLPMSALVVLALLGYRSEGWPFRVLPMRDRFRLQRMDFCTWLWTGSLSVFMYGGRFAIFLSFGLALVVQSLKGGKIERTSCLAVPAALFSSCAGRPTPGRRPASHRYFPAGGTDVF